MNPVITLMILGAAAGGLLGLVTRNKGGPKTGEKQAQKTKPAPKSEARKMEGLTRPNKRETVDHAKASKNRAEPIEDTESETHSGNDAGELRDDHGNESGSSAGTDNQGVADDEPPNDDDSSGSGTGDDSGN